MSTAGPRGRYPDNGRRLELTIYVDRCSVEVFAQNGKVTMTESIFPAPTSTDVAVYAVGGTATINSLHIDQYE